MAHFNQKPGTKSATHYLKNPVRDIEAFDSIVRSLIAKNPLGCTSCYHRKKNHPPLEKVREMYTAKFVYEDADRNRVGAGQEMYNSVEGYRYGIAAVLSNMANVSAHCGKARHIPDSDLFSVILKCHDPCGEIYFLALARNRLTVASYEDDAIRENVSAWTDSMAALR